jgi:hypothetical protein
MKRQPVESSNLAAIGYDPISKTLEIELNHGGVYQYFGVLPAAYQQLMNAPSLGQYFFYSIRRAYKCAFVS